MNKQMIPSGSTIRVNAPTARAIHGKTASVRSYNPDAVNGSGKTVGMYAVLVDGFYHPSFLYESEMTVIKRAPAPASAEEQAATRLKVLDEVEDLLIEAQADVKDTTALLAQQKQRVIRLTELADLVAGK